MFVEMCAWKPQLGRLLSNKKKEKTEKRSNLEWTCLAVFPQWEPVPGERLRVEVPPHGAKGKREGVVG